MRMPKSFLAVTVAAILPVVPLVAHHGWTNYHEDKPMTLEGVIRESTYENPHGTARLETKDKTWLIILAPVARMQRNGLTEEMLKPGTRATVVGYQHKTVEDEMRAERITIDGKTVELRR
jgi:hypothetical protein